jgi:hypothetical protein
MKKIISLILALALTCGAMLTLASCGGDELVGTYSGSFFYDPEDTITIKINKDKTVEYKLVLASGSETVTAKGAYTLEVEEDHGHEVIKFSVPKECESLISMLGGAEYTYSIAKVNGKKTLTLTGHGNSYLNLTLTAVK